MIDKFEQWFEGTFDNKIQAFTNPSKYAYIVLQHVKVADGLFYGEQAYFNKRNTPYRQFCLKLEEKDNTIIVRNFELHDKKRYLGFVNLQELRDLNLTHRVGCDTIFTYYSDVIGGRTTDRFVGQIEPGCGCRVDWGSRETYLVNNAILTDSCYNVEDKGHDPKTHEHVWGSKHGHFNFIKKP